MLFRSPTYRAGRRGRREARAIAGAEQAPANDLPTAVLNRRGFDEAVERELARARRHDRPVALGYLDVRGLMAVNDGERQVVGDELITQVAGLVRDCARAGDVAGWLGGDEFGLVLAERGAEGAAMVRGRLRAQLRTRQPRSAPRCDGSRSAPPPTQALASRPGRCSRSPTVTVRAAGHPAPRKHGRRRRRSDARPAPSRPRSNGERRLLALQNSPC